MYLININIHIEKLTREEFQPMLLLHCAWIDSEVRKKNFLLAGPYSDKEGAGIVIARQMERRELNKILANDIFHTDRLASYTVREFEALDLIPEILNEKTPEDVPDER